MFKARNKITTIINISIGVALTANITFFGYGNSISFNAGLEKASNLTYGTKTITADKSISKGDIFMSNYKYLGSPLRSSALSSLSAVRKNIIGNPTKCNSEPTDNDILLILSSSKDFQQHMYTISDIPLSTKFNAVGSLTESCQKIIYCLGYDKTQTIDSRKEIQNCQNIVYQKYILMESLGSSYLSQPTAHRNDNIFIDNNPQNASFDLLNDIEEIKSILFADKNSPQIPEMVYYSMPSVTIPGQSTTPIIPGGISAFGGGAVGSSSLTGTSLNNGNTTNNSNNNNITNLSNNDLSIQNFINSNNNSNTINNNGLSNDTDNILDTIKDIGIQNAYCPIPGINNNGNNGNNNDQNETDYIEDEFEEVQGELFNALSGFLYYGSGVGDITNLNNLNNLLNDNLSGNNGSNGNNNVILTEEPSQQSQQCSTNCENTTGQIEKQICEGKCCISACSTLSSSSQKAICISQCLCGEFKTKNDEIRIRFCRVPAQPARIVANKYVTTVESAIDSISNIFKYLKQNNRMAKRTKTKELLDTSFTKTKLNKILSFNIFIAIKPIFDKISNNVQKEIIIKKDIALRQAIHPTGTTLGDQRDKNKYIVIGSHAKTLAEKSIVSSFNDFNNNIREIFSIQCQQQGKIINEEGECKNKEDIKNNIIEHATYEQTSSLINDELYKFIDENYVFWHQTAENFSNMLQTSQTLRKKAEAAK